jgi:hypothetical protein
MVYGVRRRRKSVAVRYGVSLKKKALAKGKG